MSGPLQQGDDASATLSPEEARALGRYTGARLAPGAPGCDLPLPDEPFVACWRRWVDRARERGAWAVLSEHWPQIWFPIAEGISRSADYRAATLRGEARGGLDGATGLTIERPEAVSLELYPSFAGCLPIVTVRHRPDFVTLFRAFAKRNEPVPVPPSQGAAMIAGLINWERVRALSGDGKLGGAWEWARLRERPERYQDRLILLHDGPYSGVAASELGLPEERWRSLSLVLRREHECCHYYTRRIFGVMRNHLVDELAADYVGLVAATGRFSADWFLRFIGAAGSGGVRPGSRLEIYRGDPPLGGRALEVVRGLVRDAAANLQAFDRSRWGAGAGRESARRAGVIEAVMMLSLRELASSRGVELLGRVFDRVLEARSTSSKSGPTVAS